MFTLQRLHIYIYIPILRVYLCEPALYYEKRAIIMEDHTVGYRHLYGVITRPHSGAYVLLYPLLEARLLFESERPNIMQSQSINSSEHLIAKCPIALFSSYHRNASAMLAIRRRSMRLIDVSSSNLNAYVDDHRYRGRSISVAVIIIS